MGHITPNSREVLYVLDTATGEPVPLRSSGDALDVNASISLSASDIQIGAVEVKNGSDDTRLTVFDYTSSNPIAVRLTDTNGDYIAAGAGTQYTEDDAAAANPVGTAIIAVRADALAAVTTTDGDNIALRATNKGEVYVKHADSVAVTGTFWQATQPVSAASLPLPTGAATEAKQDTLIGHVDGIEGLLTTVAGAVSGTEVQADILTVPADPFGVNADAASATGSISAKLRFIASTGIPITGTVTVGAHAVTNAGIFAVQDATAQASLSVLDDWDEADRAKVNPIAGQAGVQGGSGVVSALTQRVVLATDVALPAGTNAIGKLAANSGVDIGDVDITSVVPGTAATSLGKAEDAGHTSGDTGIFALGVRNDTLADVTSATADYSQLSTDLKGRVMTANAPRALKIQQQTTITSSTTETTVLTAVASTFLDVYGVIVTNTSATVTKVTFKDSTTGTTRFVIEVPATETRGFMLPVDAAIPQATVNTNWTATCGTSVASVEITVLAVKMI